MTFNPMFEKKKKPEPKVINSTNVRENNNSEVKKQRKTRSDKKDDIKIPLTIEQRILVRKFANKNEMAPTPYTGHILKKGLSRGIPFPEPAVPYPSKSTISFHAKLEVHFLNKLDEWAILWDCSRRKAAYRILMGMLKVEEGTSYERKY
jgi:hypothetical protein